MLDLEKLHQAALIWRLHSLANGQLMQHQLETRVHLEGSCREGKQWVHCRMLLWAKEWRMMMMTLDLIHHGRCPQSQLNEIWS